MRVLVICLNPSVDKTCVLPVLTPRRRHHLPTVLALAGGKGINAARVLRRLGARPLVLGFTAGHSGRFIEEATRAEGIAARWVRPAEGESRTCLSVLHGGTAPTELNEVGPRIGKADLSRFLAAYRAELESARMVILSGSLPPGVPAGIYARLIRLGRTAGRPVFLDASGAALRLGLAARPDLAKLNEEEALSVGLGPRRILPKKGPDLVVTLGPRGAVGRLGGRMIRCVPPKVRALSPVGCGDTFMAGLAWSLLRASPPEAALAYATALATASARVLGAGVFRKRDLAEILSRVRTS